MLTVVVTVYFRFTQLVESVSHVVNAPDGRAIVPETQRLLRDAILLFFLALQQLMSGTLSLIFIQDRIEKLYPIVV
jgi:hypothetical protein